LINVLSYNSHLSRFRLLKDWDASFLQVSLENVNAKALADLAIQYIFIIVRAAVQ
jgi:hypothetical protein